MITHTTLLTLQALSTAAAVGITCMILAAALGVRHVR